MRIRRNLSKFIILSAFILFMTCLLVIAPKAKAGYGLVICDVHSENPRIVKDDGSIEYADYVRIRNLTDAPYDLTGLTLADSKKDNEKLPLDGIVVDAGEDVMIKLDPSWNFALKSSGVESVYLSDAFGNVLYKYTSKMKPPAPVMSADSGFYDEEFELEIIGKKGKTVRYTLDGSEPDEDSPVYTSPIRVYDRSGEPNSVVNVENTIKNYLDEEADGAPVEKPKEEIVDKAFIIRAAAFDEYGNRSETVTREYFFCGDRYRNIVSLVADRDDLFGDCGILSVGREYDEWYLGDRSGDAPEVNFNKKGREWEVPADMEYFRGGKKVLSQRCGLKLFGRTTRNNRIKNFQLRARDNYSGSDVFEYPFFANEDYASDRITLDDSFTESFFFSLVDGEEIIKHRTTDRAALFLNGEFWNNIYIRQKFDEKYFSDHYDISPDNLIVLNDSFPEIGGDDEESYEEARNMYISIDEFALENDLSLDENYEKIQTMIDIDSYIDYLAINTWAGNNDWDEYTNSMCWRVRKPYDDGYADGRFRFMLHDGDFIFRDIISLADQEYIDRSPLLKSIMKNSSFRKKLAARILELGRTTFSDAHIKKELAKPEWDEPEKKMIDEFFKTRKDRVNAFAYELAGKE